MTLRTYQQKLSDDIDACGGRSILATMATGGGKSVMTAHRARLCRGASVIMAHRQELVYQLSMALARDEIEHRIMAPDAVIKHIIEKQIAEFNRNYVYERAQHTVASVDTLLARADGLGNWPRQVELVQIDEAHHVLGGDHINKWGRAFNIFPQAQRIGWTGTGMRPDRKPLRSAFDSLVVGPTTAELLALGCLCPYRIYGPPSSIDVAGLAVGGSGDYAGAELRKRAHKSTVTGDMVQHYLKLTPGAVGIAFLVDVEQAKETADRFNAAGVPAAWMSSRETDDRTRVRTMDALRCGALKLICNVDLLGEGVDVPRVEVVLDGRPTMSLVRYLQVFGRLLRTYPGKEHGVYIDLVGNVVRHGLPDTPRTWTLDVPEKRKATQNDETALKACPECFQVFERFLASCPHCGFKPTPAGRSRPEEVDGDLTEFSEELLARLRGQAAEIMGPCPPGVAPYVVQNWNARAVTQQQLRDALAMWQGVQEQRHGYDIATGSRLFWHRFGIDAATAQTLGRKQAAELYDRVWGDINNECSRPKRGPVGPVVVDENDRPDRLVEGQVVSATGYEGVFKNGNNYGWQRRINGERNEKSGYLTPELARDARQHFIDTGEILEPPVKSATGYEGVKKSGKNNYKWEMKSNDKLTSKSGYLTAELARDARQHFIDTGEIIEPPVKSATGYEGVVKHSNNYGWRRKINGQSTYKSGYLTPELAHAARQHFIDTGEIIEPPVKSATGYTGVSKSKNKYQWYLDLNKKRTYKHGYLTPELARDARQHFIDTGEILEP